MLDALFSLNPRLQLANQRLCAAHGAYPQVHELVDVYLQAYARHHALTLQQIDQAYDFFARLYNQHLADYQKTGHYPARPTETLPPHCYHVALILSCVLSPARLQIMAALMEVLGRHPLGHCAVIGCGVGLELELIERFQPGTTVHAFDLDVLPFIQQRFAKQQFTAQAFDENSPASFDTVLAIEILEHLAQPLTLMEHVVAKLKPGGRCLCTTATHMPQFDHLSNFTDIPAFTAQLENMGFAVEQHATFLQPYPFYGITGQNDWFQLIKIDRH